MQSRAKALWTYLAASLRKEGLLWALALIGVALEVAIGDKPREVAGLVDWPTIAALSGLIVLTKALERTGALNATATVLLRTLRTERALGIGLVILSAGLAAIVTNDVALFVVVPLTLSIAQRTALPTMRLVVFEALAVNVGSAFTPVGNPQNLFLWQHSGSSALGFMAAMAPFFVIGICLLGMLSACALSGRRLGSQLAPAPAPPLPTMRLVATLGLYALFLVLVDFHLSGWGLFIIALAFLRLDRAAIIGADWALMAIFVLMFIDLRLVAALPAISAAMGSAHLGDARHLFVVTIACSQFISNVPATILLSEYSRDWQIIGLGANIGGFGLIIGSLANIIALRIHRERGAWLMFHAYSVPFCAVMTFLLFFWTFR